MKLGRREKGGGTTLLRVSSNFLRKTLKVKPCEKLFGHTRISVIRLKNTTG